MGSKARILRLNKAGLPVAWLSHEQAATLYVRGQVIWHLGDDLVRLHGGLNRLGRQSYLDLAPIIACEGDPSIVQAVPSLSNRYLFRRDGHFCMYCGGCFTDRELTRDHIVPKVQGGVDRWHNVVAACRRCNHFKGGRTPEQAGMELLAIPFEPNMFEFMYLANRQILGDQMDYLAARFSGMREWKEPA